MSVAAAARLADVHRATVYRWRAGAAFADAMRAAADAFYREHRARVVAEEAARQRWREEARRPMRCYYLARARAAKRRSRLQFSAPMDVTHERFLSGRGGDGFDADV